MRAEKATGEPLKKYLIRIEDADVVLDGREVLHGISWELKPGEHWAVTGRNGSGKSTFLRLLQGEVRPMPDRGRVVYCFEGEEMETPLGVRDHVASVTPELHEAYIRNGRDMSGEEVIHTGFFHSVWLHERPTPALIRTADALIEKLEVEELRDKSILAMSQGEARKVLIARALVAGPALLLLDEIGDGLDASSRENILALLERAAKGGTQIISATHRTEELIPSVSRILCLRGGRIYSSGRPEDCSSSIRPPVSQQDGRRTGVQAAAMVSSRRRRGGGKVLFSIENASLYADDRRILDRIDWQMAEGENWAVLGRNGSGKSSLLKLISGDLHPALGGSVGWFGAAGRRSIWEVRKRIGCVSPELQALYDDDLSGIEVVLSGFFSSRGLYRKVGRRQLAKARELMASLRIERLGKERVGRMSYGGMRKVLIARALTNSPALLLLDEPCSGLDRQSREDFLGFMEELARAGTGIVMATHHRDELIPSISHVLLLEGGRVIGRGTKEEILHQSSLTAAV
jgi:molybdate transport system ATP-binding protein